MKQMFTKLLSILKRSSFRSNRRNSDNDKPIPNIVFFHIPRCGGSSLVNAICQSAHFTQPISIKAVRTRKFGRIVWQDFHEEPPLPPSEAFYQYYTFKFREYVLLYYLACEYDFVHGHVLFSLHAYEHFKEQYNFVTVVREPVQRFLSQYKFSAGNEQTLDEFLEQKHKGQHGSVLVRYFSGKPDKESFATNEQVMQAIGNIDKFDLIGMLEHLEEFKNDFFKKFHLELTIPHLNKSPNFSLKISLEQRRKIIKCCEPDIVLYEEIKKRKMK